MIPAPERDERGPAGPPGIRPYLQAAPPPAASGDLPTTGSAPTDPAATTAPRPFVITAGRVAGPDPDIGVETQVTALTDVTPVHLPPEAQAIVALCGEPMSVAEISARLRLHLGVTKILVGDLRAAGHLAVHVRDDEVPDPDTILRVIRGLRAIS